MRLRHTLAFVLVGCSMAPVAPAGLAPAGDHGLPPVRAALEFPPDAKQVTLGWLVTELGRLTQQEITLSEALRDELEKTIEPLEITTPVPADEVYAFIEGLLVQHQVVVAPVKGGTRPVLGIYGVTQSRAPVSWSLRPVVVDPQHLALLDEHPALHCQLVLNFQNIDSRQLQTQLRQLLVDSTGFQQVVPCGDRSLLLQGCGQTLAGLATMLLEVDRASAGRPATPPPQEFPPKGPPPPQQPSR